MPIAQPIANVIRILYRPLQGTPFRRPAAGRSSQVAVRRPQVAKQDDKLFTIRRKGRHVQIPTKQQKTLNLNPSASH